jgi:hypothetical protein
MAKAGTATETSAGERDEVDELFDNPATGSDDDFDDLLDAVVEDDSEGWVPEQAGEGIVGTLVKIGETRSDFVGEGGDPMCPTWTIQVKDGTKFRVIGYGAVLKREINDANAEVGDKVAVKYFGEKKLRTGRFAGKMYKHFGVAVRKP